MIGIDVRLLGSTHTRMFLILRNFISIFLCRAYAYVELYFCYRLLYMMCVYGFKCLHASTDRCETI